MCDYNITNIIKFLYNGVLISNVYQIRNVIFIGLQIYFNEYDLPILHCAAHKFSMRTFSDSCDHNKTMRGWVLTAVNQYDNPSFTH